MILRPYAEKLLEFVSTDWGPFVLVVHAYFEGFILPVTHELFLIPVCLGRPNLSLLFALMSTTASTLGILTGYTIGRFGGHPILQKIFSKQLLDKAEEYIHKHDFWAIAIACFTPIPVKVFAFLAGSLEINVKKLAIVAFIFRGARYFLVSILLYFYGKQAREWILHYLDWVMGALFALMIVGYIAIHIVERFLKKKGLSSEEPPQGAAE